MKQVNWKILIILGLIPRLFLSFWTGHPWDFETFIRVGASVAKGVSPTKESFPSIPGLGQPIFTTTAGIGYPPAWGLVLGLVYKIYEIFPFTPYIYYFLLKMPAILGDLLSTFLIYKIITMLNENKLNAEKTSIKFFLSPLVIIISSLWGMFDSIVISFILLSTFFYLKKKYFTSAICLGISIYFKVIPIIFLMLPVLFLLKYMDIQKAIKYLYISIFTPFIFTLIPTLYFGWSINEIFQTIFSQTLKIGDSLTYWNILSTIREINQEIVNDEILQNFFSFPLVRYLYLLGIIIGYYFIYEKIKLPIKNYWLLHFHSQLIVTLLFLLTRPFIPEQFSLYLIYPLLIINCEYHRKTYNMISLLALIFLFINNIPFSFSYLIEPHLYTLSTIIISNQPFSLIRYILRSTISTIFCFILFKTLIYEVKIQW